MHVGLIPPIPHLDEFGIGPFHLILSHLLEHQAYGQHYSREAERGSYLVLDNSAHEFGEGEDSMTLLEQALELGVREIVCPDVLDNAKETVEKTTSALELYAKNLETLDRNRIQLMIVPQGESIYAWGLCLDSLYENYRKLFGDRPVTIGISKDYEVWVDGLAGLINRFVSQLSREKTEVHLLGWGRQLHQLSSLSFQFPWLRSTDSAKPFVYALGGIELTLDLESPEYPTRPGGYFHKTFSERQLEIARNNVSVFRQRAKFRNTPVLGSRLEQYLTEKAVR